MREILIATRNPGKILEYKELFKDLTYQLVTLKDVGIDEDPEEDGKSFEENATKKAEFYSKLVNMPVLAEDSGLEIDYLHGEPGVRSRRWLGRESTDHELIDKALEALKGVPKDKRGAQFKVVIAFKPFENAHVKTAQGFMKGYITEVQKGELVPGFPFRTIFYVPEKKKVLAELPMAEESQFGHRKQALDQLIPKINTSLAGNIMM